MESRLTFLLCLGLCLSARIQAYQFSGPPPELRMRPSNIRPLGSNVIFSCYTPLRADYFRILMVFHDQWGAEGEEHPAIYPGHEIHMYLPRLRVDHGNRYHCLYRTGLIWSRPSKYLDLVISDVAPSPLMTITPLVVRPGGRFNIRCKTQGYETTHWVLLKGEVKLQNHVLTGSRPVLDHTVYDAQEKHSGEYRCFAYNWTGLHIWSSSSNPVTVYVGTKNITMVTTVQQNSVSPRSPGVPLTSVVLALISLQSQWA